MNAERSASSDVAAPVTRKRAFTESRSSQPARMPRHRVHARRRNRRARSPPPRQSRRWQPPSARGGTSGSAGSVAEHRRSGRENPGEARPADSGNDRQRRGKAARGRSAKKSQRTEEVAAVAVAVSSVGPALYAGPLHAELRHMRSRASPQIARRKHHRSRTSNSASQYCTDCSANPQSISPTPITPNRRSGKIVRVILNEGIQRHADAGDQAGDQPHADRKRQRRARDGVRARYR